MNPAPYFLTAQAVIDTYTHHELSETEGAIEFNWSPITDHLGRDLTHEELYYFTQTCHLFLENPDSLLWPLAHFIYRCEHRRPDGATVQ